MLADLVCKRFNVTGLAGQSRTDMTSTLFPRTTNARGSRSVQRILDAAARLFGRDGYDGASMISVARAAGVSKGLLHYHFRSKEHLLIAAHKATLRQVHLRFQERFNQGDRGMETALDGLDALWGALRELEDWAPFMVETMALAAQGRRVRPQMDEFFDEVMPMLEDGLRKAFAGDTDRLVLPPRRMALVMRTMLQGLVVDLAFARGPSERERVYKTYADLRELFASLAFHSPHSEAP
jgi:AcrR family transcriptional regulator